MEMTESELHDIEEKAVGAPLTLERQWIGQLCSEVRRLRHELNDPNYQYVGRIHRQGIISRNGEIDRLRGEVSDLKKQIAALTPSTGA